MNNKNTLLFIALVGASTGCSDDPVSYSSPVGINLKAKADGNTELSESKGITTESANPYGAFVTDATKKLGRSPGRIDIDAATLTLGGDSKDVASLDSVFASTADIAFVIDDTNNTYEVGTVDPSGTGPSAIDVGFDGSQIAAQDTAKYVAGSFKVVVRGTAAPTFPGSSAEASLQLTFTFAAFE